MGRAMIADPDLPVKTFLGREDEIRPCTACCLGCTDRMDLQLDISCQTNPMVGRELDFKSSPASKKKRVAIVGAGPAGLEAARVAALRGHEVFLYERERRLGGQLNLAAVLPGKKEYGALIGYYDHQMRKFDVNVVYKEANKQEIAETKPDIIILATGAKAPNGKGIRVTSKFILSTWDVLRGENMLGDKVVIIGGGQVGCETAAFLIAQGKSITILEKSGDLAAGMSKRAKVVLIRDLINAGANIIKYAYVTEISDSEVRFERAGLKQKVKNFDHAILASGRVPERALLEEIGEGNVPVFSIGDCVSPRTAMEAIREGFDLGLEI